VGRARATVGEETWQDRRVNASQEPGQPQHPSTPPVDPTADPALYRRPGGGAEGAAVAIGSEAPAEGDGFGLAHPVGPEAAEAVAAGGGPGWEPRRSVRRPWRRTLVVSVLSGLVVFVLGGPLGLLWAWLAPTVPVIETGGPSGIVVNDPSPEEYIAADGWFTLLGLAFGLIVAIVAWLVMRRDRGPFMLLGVVAGTLGAGYLAAPWVGEMIGRGDYERWQQTAAAGATYLAPPQVHSLGPTLVPAFVAAIVLTLLAGWSNDPDLDAPGAKPGYGPNAAADRYAADPNPAGPFAADPYAAGPYAAGQQNVTGQPNATGEPYAAKEPYAVSGWPPVGDSASSGPAGHTQGEPPRA